MVNREPLTHETLTAFHQALLEIRPSESMEPSLREQVLIRGILIVLQEDGSREAVELLLQTVLSCPISSGTEHAFKTLQSLSTTGNQDAIDGLFQLAIDHEHLAAQNHLLEHQLESSHPEQTAVLHLLAGSLDNHSLDLDSLNLLTKTFFASTDAVRQNMLSAARQSGLKNWAAIASAARVPSEPALTQLLSDYPSLQPVERALFRALLLENSKNGSQICSDTFCELFIRYEDAAVKQLAIQNQIFPQNTIPRALFLFLAEQWEAYHNHDFNHVLIAAAYETGTQDIRKRILTISRESGFTDWLKDLHAAPSRSVRLLTDLTTRDWETTLQVLLENKNWDAIWRLALAAPPIHSAKIIHMLIKAAWTPEKPETAEILHQFGNLAAQCLKHPLELAPTHTLSTGLAVLNLAASQDETVLAAGTRDGEVHLWRKPLFTPLGSLQLGAVQGVRALTVEDHGRLSGCRGW